MAVFKYQRVISGEIALGTGGTLAPPTVGQVLQVTAINGNFGVMGWTDSVSATGLEAINEGNGIGWRLIGRNPATFGDIGLNAIDFSFSFTPSTTLGATGNYSAVLGGSNSTASATGSVTVGRGNTASANDSAVFGGNLNTASGVASISAGNNNVASASNSSCVGGDNNVASGNGSYVTGRFNTAFSWVENVIGLFATTYTPGSTSAFDSNDRLFNIGNGMSTVIRSDAFTVLKNGSVGIDIDNFQIGAASRQKLEVNGNILADQFRLSALNTPPSSASDTGTLGEIRIDADYIYICTATNTWKRVQILTF